ncbi:hypothetical protein CYMTET_13368 [Cymbomonas tetramitiformis]|uniref:Uncharacterized protein n=1 Tax=Cymbomonas tetramitiformis TaxID=36881 RepID=A0AAE0GIU0_9CHLO|nr:hypothetical protein CYMTET_13368 [Cymbomonas tetramitiformis]
MPRKSSAPVALAARKRAKKEVELDEIRSPGKDHVAGNDHTELLAPDIFAEDIGPALACDMTYTSDLYGSKCDPSKRKQKSDIKADSQLTENLDWRDNVFFDNSATAHTLGGENHQLSSEGHEDVIPAKPVELVVSLESHVMAPATGMPLSGWKAAFNLRDRQAVSQRCVEAIRRLQTSAPRSAVATKRIEHVQGDVLAYSDGNRQEILNPGRVSTAEEDPAKVAIHVVKENQATVQHLLSIADSTLKIQKSYKILGLYLLFLVYYAGVLSTQRPVQESYNIVSTLEMSSLKPLEKYFDGVEPIVDWLYQLVTDVWTKPVCGNWLCEEPYERAAFGRFGCKMDCGTEHTLYPVILEVSTSQPPTLSSNPLNLLQGLSWNICLRDTARHELGLGDLCWFRLEQTFQSFGQTTMEELHLPAGNWLIRVRNDYYRLTHGKIYNASSLNEIPTDADWTACRVCFILDLESIVG